MIPERQTRRIPQLLLNAVLLLPPALAAQEISLKSAPVATGAQFLVGGRSMPAAVLLRRGRVFGGVGGAWQELDDPNRGVSSRVPAPAANPDWPPTNHYLYAAGGTTLGDGRTSIGAALAYADLRALDGVRQLYAMNGRIAERGSFRDLRVGALRELDGGASLEATLFASGLSMTHDLGYLDWHWDPTAQRGYYAQRFVTNRDRTHTTGLELRWRSVPDSLGGGHALLLRVNHKTEPILPNYDPVGIPRDPGESWAADIGLRSDLETEGATVAAPRRRQRGFARSARQIGKWSRWTRTIARLCPDPGARRPRGGTDGAAGAEAIDSGARRRGARAAVTPLRRAAGRRRPRVVGRPRPCVSRSLAASFT